MECESLNDVSNGDQWGHFRLCIILSSFEWSSNKLLVFMYNIGCPSPPFLSYHFYYQTLIFILPKTTQLYFSDWLFITATKINLKMIYILDNSIHCLGKFFKPMG